MKKAFFIYTLFLGISCLAGLSLQAQQQKKPSERSFTEEVNRVKQMQAAQRAKVSRQQSTENTPGSSATNTQLPNQIGSNPVNNNTQIVKPQQPAIKPSERPIKALQKPVRREQMPVKIAQ